MAADRASASSVRTGHRITAVISVCTIVQLAALLPGVARAAAPAECHNIETRDGITVCEREVAQSSFLQFQAAGEVCATWDVVLAYLRDVDRLHEWFPNVQAAELLREEPRTQIQYILSRTPWPFKSRDMVYRITYTEPTVDTSGRDGADSLQISIEGLPDFLPPADNAVRMRAASGGWTLSTRNGRTHILFQMHVDPGNVPGMFANRQTKNTVRGALRALAKRFPCD